MNLFRPPTRNTVIQLLLCGWVLCVLLAIITHWRVLRYFSILILVGAIGFFMISLLYALISVQDKDPDQK